MNDKMETNAIANRLYELSPAFAASVGQNATNWLDALTIEQLHDPAWNEQVERVRALRDALALRVVGTRGRAA